jgi:hypothetical protein
MEAMLGRLIVGILKGLIVGGLIGFGLLKLGFAVLPLWLAYIAAPIAGVIIGLIAGKPIWAKDAKIEAGMKALVGALLGAGLMFAARKWLTMPLVLPPAATDALGATDQLLRAQADGRAATLGTFAMTSLAMIAAVLGGFYDADNTPGAEATSSGKPAQTGARVAVPSNKRVATGKPSSDDEFDEDLDVGADQKQAKK